MDSGDWEGAPPQDYLDRSTWTTWTISYEAIHEKQATAANLLLLWAFLNSEDLWYGFFAVACGRSETVASGLSSCVGSIANIELQFITMRLLLNYSLVERVSESGSYATHSVVHQWAYHFQEVSSRQKLAQLAVTVVGLAVPSTCSRDYSTLQGRLLPHAQACSPWVGMNEIGPSSQIYSGGSTEDQVKKESIVLHDAFLLLGNLCKDQGKLEMAEQMY
jgi:hypothetical protein